MTAPYDTSCLYNGGWFDSFNCLVVNSNFILLYVLYLTLFAILYAVFAGSQQNTKNTLLLASSVTAVISIFFAIGAAIDNYSSTVIIAYSSAAIFCSTVAVVFLLYHILSDL